MTTQVEIEKPALESPVMVEDVEKELYSLSSRSGIVEECMSILVY